MRIPALLLCTLLIGAIGSVQARDLSPEEELLASEKLREQVEDAFLLCTDPPEGIYDQRSGCLEASRRLQAMGPEIIPFLENELLQETPVLDFLAINTLGFMPSEKTAGILKETIQRLDRSEENTKTRNKKVSALLALAIQGDPAVVDLANSGKVYVGLDRHLYQKVPALVVMAVLTAPESIPRLEKQIALYSGDDRYLDQLLAATFSLAQVAVPGSFDTLAELSKHPEWPVRMATVDGFRRLGDRRSIDRLFEFLKDEPDGRVRGEAALCLERLKPVEDYERLLAALETETYYPIRGTLYKIVAQIGGADAVPALLQHGGSRDPNDRRVLVTALGWTGSTRALPLVRQSVQDPSASVGMAALEALNRIGTPGAVDSLLAAIANPSIPVASTAVRLLVQRGERRAGPRIAARLLSRFLERDAPPEDREIVGIFARALVELEQYPAHRELSAAFKRQTDLTVRDTLLEVTGQLRLLETNGDDVDAWAALLDHENHATRSLAITRLGRIAGAKAIDLLLKGFDEQDVEYQIDVVRNLHRADVGRIAPLLEEIMMSEKYDPPRFGPLRATAAWTAGRIGGRRMIDLLLTASEQVQGTNWYYLLYLMKAAGKDAIPHLQATRIPRLRQLDPWRWHETRILEAVADDLLAGVHNPLLDTPPEHLEIQQL